MESSIMLQKLKVALTMQPIPMLHGYSQTTGSRYDDSTHRYIRPLVKGTWAGECWPMAFFPWVLVVYRVLPSVGWCVGVASDCQATSFFFSPGSWFFSFFCGHALNWNGGICNLVSRPPYNLSDSGDAYSSYAFMRRRASSTLAVAIMIPYE